MTHAVWRCQATEQQRWTLDLSVKRGRESPDSERIAGSAPAVCYDYESVFIHLVRDRKVNFTADDQTRLSLGLRF